MSALIFLIPIALFLGLLGLIAFIWASKNGQFEDLEGAANRILFDEDDRLESEKNKHAIKNVPHAKKDESQ